jgi:thiamine biosynthesis lipoprotein
VRAWLVVIGLSAASRGAVAQDRHEFVAVHMGVPVRIVLYASSEAVARAAATAAYERIAELDGIMSDYRPRSEVRLLSERPREWQLVSRDLVRVLALAQDVSRWSGGAFDVTVGPLVQLWRQSRRSGRLPDEAALSRARSRTGWQLLEVDTIRVAVRLLADSMQIDLGGIAKGYILSEALARLRSRGSGAAMIEAGGDLVVGDAPPGRAGWSVEIPGADSATRDYAKALVNVSVATSGGSEQFVEIGGVRYAHVVDARTGLGLVNAGEVTVLARRGEVADAVATATLVLSQRAALGVRRPMFGGVLHVVSRPVGSGGGPR